MALASVLQLETDTRMARVDETGGIWLWLAQLCGLDATLEVGVGASAAEAPCGGWRAPLGVALLEVVQLTHGVRADPNEAEMAPTLALLNGLIRAKVLELDFVPSADSDNPSDSHTPSDSHPPSESAPSEKSVPEKFVPKKSVQSAVALDGAEVSADVAGRGGGAGAMSWSTELYLSPLSVDALKALRADPQRSGLMEQRLALMYREQDIEFLAHDQLEFEDEAAGYAEWDERWAASVLALDRDAQNGRIEREEAEGRARLLLLERGAKRRALDVRCREIARRVEALGVRAALPEPALCVALREDGC